MIDEMDKEINRYISAINAIDGMIKSLKGETEDEKPVEKEEQNDT